MKSFYHPDSPHIWVYNGDHHISRAVSTRRMRMTDEEREFMKKRLSPEEYEKWLEEWLEMSR